MGGDRSQDAGGVPGGDNKLDSGFLAILACPVCEDHPPFKQVGDYLVCTKVGHFFPVIDGIPRLLPENVIPAEKAEELLIER